MTLFGHTFAPGFPAYLAIALAGTVGYLIGAVIGWEIGRRGGRPYLERHGRWLHLDHAKLERAEAWFLRWEDWAVLLGRLTPVVRSFVSIPAGIFEAPLQRYTVLTLIGSAIWCFVFAAIGWAAGASWESFHSAFRYADVAVARGRRRRCRLARLALPAQAAGRAGELLTAGDPACRSARPARVPTPVRRRRPVHSDVVIPLVDVKAQYAPLIPELKERFAEVLESGRFIFGPEVEAFEQRVGRLPRRPARDRRRERHGRPRPLARGDGDRRRRRGDLPVVHVLRDSEAIARVGATPVFADIDPVTSTSTRPTSPRGSRRGRRRSCPSTCSAAPRRSPSSRRSGCR